jgi:hypothetical protein
MKKYKYAYPGIDIANELLVWIFKKIVSIVKKILS